MNRHMPLWFSLHPPKLPNGFAWLSFALALCAVLVFGPALAADTPDSRETQKQPTRLVNPQPKPRAAELGLPPASVAPLQQETQSNFEELTKTIASLHEDLDRQRQDTTFNTKSIEDMKAKFEELSILIYAHLSAPAPNQALSDDSTDDAADKGRAETLSAEALAAALLALVTLLGFALLESAQLESWAVPQAGLRNLLVAFALGLAYFAVGHGLMCGTSATANDNGLAEALRQTALAMAAGLVAATILSDRLSLPACLFMAVFMGTLAYPLLGQWAWGGHTLPEKVGWLEKWGFIDFAGASVIHSFAAWFALAWAFRLPLSRPLAPEGEHGHSNASLGLLGLSVAWFGWFGFSLGHGGGGFQGVAAMALNILLAGAAALLSTLSSTLVLFREAKPGVVYARVGAGTLGGLVAISAGMADVSPAEATVIGMLAGLAHPLFCRALSAWLIKDDQVAANMVAAHGFCGLLGTLCVGLFASPGSFAPPEFGQLGIQAGGIAVVLAYGTVIGFLGALLCQGAARLPLLDSLATRLGK